VKYRRHKSGVKSNGDFLNAPWALGACFRPEDKLKGSGTKVTSVTPRVTAVKKTTPRTTVAAKNDAGAARIVEKKGAAAHKRSASAERVATAAIRPEERHHLIEVAAYCIAERHGFHGALPLDDWLQAEREIDAMIEAGKFAA
jgi:DUF2934 family protein